MSSFLYKEGQLHAEAVPLAQIAEQFGTPAYVYSSAAIKTAWHAYHQAFSGCAHLICYAVKANSNLTVLSILAQLGSGFDIVSAGELLRVIRAGGDMSKVVFSGVGKTDQEIRYALKARVKCFNIESPAELHRIDRIAAQVNLRAPISIRVNPDVDAATHPYIATGLKENKFGIAFEQAEELYHIAATLTYIEIIGIACHIGSQITSLGPFCDAIGRLLSLAKQLESKGIAIRYIDIGGGLGIRYQKEPIPSIGDYASAVRSLIDRDRYTVLIEPGRSIVGHAGVLLTRVEYIKPTMDRNFAIVDAAMNDLIRPALYDGWHDIKTVFQDKVSEPNCYNIVGPICETSDFLAKDRVLALAQHDLLAICDAGAYGFTMCSNYNSRLRPCELMVDGKRVFEVRSRETPDQLMAGESVLPE